MMHSANSNIHTVGRTQEVDVTAQLKLGARMLQGQAHMYVYAACPLAHFSFVASGKMGSSASAIPVRIHFLWHKYIV